MPLYLYHCSGCDNKWESAHTIADRYDELCPKCNKKAHIHICGKSMPIVYNYFSENLDTYITGPGHRKKVMKKMGLEECG